MSWPAGPPHGESPPPGVQRGTAAERWLGYIVQRPESHSIHHGRGVHAFNYSNFPVFDMLFGTFRNAERFEPETGFYDGASTRIGEMLVFRDVSRPPAA